MKCANGECAKSIACVELASIIMKSNSKSGENTYSQYEKLAQEPDAATQVDIEALSRSARSSPIKKGAFLSQDSLAAVSFVRLSRGNGATCTRTWRMAIVNSRYAGSNQTLIDDSPVHCMGHPLTRPWSSEVCTTKMRRISLSCNRIIIEL